MKRAENPGGFSLMEVVLSIGVVVFATVAMLGAFPVGLKEGAASVNETRATQLANQVFASLKNPPFNAVRIGNDQAGDATMLDLTSTEPQQVWAYAAYPGNGLPCITNVVAGQSPFYVLRLTSSKLDSDVTGELGARMVTLTVYPRDPRISKDVRIAEKQINGVNFGAVKFSSIVRNF
jgi:Tfp pilus assembly protein PilV